ncbi:MAG: HAMP domain-containing histidine kinase [Eubacterium sp.]|nr:HAMP domain-containing histidine kinase [Eubacterium sp.]
MLQRLRLRFVITSMCALLAVLALVMLPVYYLVERSFSAQIEVILDLLLDNGGDMPGGEGGPIDMPFRVSLEQRYETRFFSVFFDTEGNAAVVNTRSVYIVDDAKAEQIAREVYTKKRLEGRYEDNANVYLYKVKRGERGTLICFVDCTSRIWIIRQAMTYLISVGLIILLCFVLLMGKLSKKVVKPFVENSERQKRFITNASHELKTPLAVISANTEMMEIENGKSKWTEATMRQVERLNRLVSELVTLSRLDEKDELVLSEVDMTALVKEAAENFETVIKQQGKSFESQIDEGVKVRAESRSVSELCSIFLDNAAKYCDDGGMVTVVLTARGKGARLAFCNSYAAGENVDYRRFFDRFYREDESHNSKKSGFGIGLSIAQEISKHLGAKLQVAYKAGVISFILNFR